jgi:8-oxo-dGTP diphosphatase
MMNELQHCMRRFYLKKLHANIQRKMREMDILERLDKKQTGKGHKSPFLYRFVLS